MANTNEHLEAHRAFGFTTMASLFPSGPENSGDLLKRAYDMSKKADARNAKASERQAQVKAAITAKLKG